MQIEVRIVVEIDFLRYLYVFFLEFIVLFNVFNKFWFVMFFFVCIKVGVIVVLVFVVFSFFVQVQLLYSVVCFWVDECFDLICVSCVCLLVYVCNFFYFLVVMWDVWVVYGDEFVQQFFFKEKIVVDLVVVKVVCEEVMSYVVFCLFSWCFVNLEGVVIVILSLVNQFWLLGFDLQNMFIVGSILVVFGNCIVEVYIDFGLNDGFNEVNDYVNCFYQLVNDFFIFELGGNMILINENCWQLILFVDGFVDQLNILIGILIFEFFGFEWGEVMLYVMIVEDFIVFECDGCNWLVYYDLGLLLFFCLLMQEQY